MSAPRSLLTGKILMDIDNERMRQVDKWGIQHRRAVHSDPEFMAKLRDRAREACDKMEARGKVRPGEIYPYTGGASWEAILAEETFEALAETDKAAQRKELVQCAAVIVAWIEDLDSH